MTGNRESEEVTDENLYGSLEDAEEANGRPDDAALSEDCRLAFDLHNHTLELYEWFREQCSASKPPWNTILKQDEKVFARARDMLQYLERETSEHLARGSDCIWQISMVHTTPVAVFGEWAASFHEGAWAVAQQMQDELGDRLDERNVRKCREAMRLEADVKESMITSESCEYLWAGLRQEWSRTFRQYRMEILHFNQHAIGPIRKQHLAAALDISIETLSAWRKSGKLLTLEDHGNRLRVHPHGLAQEEQEAIRRKIREVLTAEQK